MKSLWIAAALFLVACTGNVHPQAVVMVIGDSVSLEWTPIVRRDLCGSIVVQHEAGNGADEPGVPQNSCKGDKQAKMNNNGCAASAIVEALPHLKQWHYNIIMFNAGLHDAQPARPHYEMHGTRYSCGGPTPMDEYRDSLEYIAEFLRKHADAVIFVETTPVQAGNQAGIPVGAQIPYNRVMEDVAQEHGIYLLTFTDVEAYSHDIHLAAHSLDTAAMEASTCIETVLQGDEMDHCHR